MKKQINLYQPSCYPKREKATFRQFLVLFAVCFFSMLTLIFILNKQLANTKETTLQHKALLTKKQDELNTLVKQLKSNRTLDSKEQQQLNLQDEIKAKQSLLASLSGIDLGVTVSFANLMRGLSLANMNTISIDSFSITDGRLNISGQTKQSDSVALWLTKVQTTKELSNLAFEKLEISATEDAQGFTFHLTNNVGKEVVKAQTK